MQTLLGLRFMSTLARLGDETPRYVDIGTRQKSAPQSGYQAERASAQRAAARAIHRRT